MSEITNPKYKRILLKLSGEALAGEAKMGFNFAVAEKICRAIKRCSDAGIQVGIVVGGGNFWRGRSSGKMDRSRADHIGMLATAMNALAVADCLEGLGAEVRVQTAIAMNQIAEPYIRQRAIRHFLKNRIVIFGCGTGNPFYSTDSAAVLRAADTCCDIVLKATLVDGVYDKDPHKFVDAKRYESLTFDEVLSKNLRVIDSSAASMCRENEIPLLVFSLSDPENIYKAAMGEAIGTLITV